MKMSKACTVKLQSKLFAVNLTWYEFTKAQDIKMASRLLKTNYGISFHSTIKNQDGFKEKKVIVGLGDKKFSACYSLAAVIADKYKDGIFITDKLIFTDNNDISTKLYWVCVFQNKEPIVKIELQDNKKNISISGDTLLTSSALTKFIDIYSQRYPTSIFTDLNDSSINIPDSIAILLDDAVSSRIASRFLIRRINRNHMPYLVGGSLCLLGLVAAFFYNQYSLQQQELLKEAHKRQTITQKKAQPTSEELVLKDIQTNSASIILNSLITFLKNTPVVIAGWSIQSIGYTANHSKQVQLLYKINDGMDIANAQSKAQDFISQYDLKDASISFQKNDQIMQLDIGLEKVSLPLIRDLTQDKVKRHINMSNGINTIASIQHNFLNYRLGTVKPFNGKYSKQDISIATIDALIFQTVTEIANKHSNLVVSSIIGKFDNNFNISWEFNGSIYE